MKIKLSSGDWSIVLGVTVIDPDGWDRKNLVTSFAEKITFEEFCNRFEQSTARDDSGKLPPTREILLARAIQALQK